MANRPSGDTDRRHCGCERASERARCACLVVSWKEARTTNQRNETNRTRRPAAVRLRRRCASCCGSAPGHCRSWTCGCRHFPRTGCASSRSKIRPSPPCLRHDAPVVRPTAFSEADARAYAHTHGRTHAHAHACAGMKSWTHDLPSARTSQ